MRLRIQGSAEGEHLAVVGVWDPILRSNEQLFRQLADDAHAQHRNALVVTLDPIPGAQMWGSAEVPAFNDLGARVSIQHSYNIDTTAVVRLNRDEIDHAGAEYFLSRLCDRVRISTIRLGASQSLGRGDAGGRAAIRDYCDAHGINVEQLPPLRHRVNARELREALRQGRVRDCVALVGHPLHVSRPRGTRVWTAWPPGPYQAIAVSGALTAVPPGAGRIGLQLKADKAGSCFTWPDRSVRWLAFVEGPADVPGCWPSGEFRSLVGAGRLA
jgi:hypothetical protein